MFAVANDTVTGSVVMIEVGALTPVATRFAARISIGAPKRMLFASPSAVVEVSAMSPFASSESRGTSVPAKNGAVPLTVRSAEPFGARSAAATEVPTVPITVELVVEASRSTREVHGATASAAPVFRSVKVALSGAPALTAFATTGPSDTRSATGTSFSIVAVMVVLPRVSVVFGGSAVEMNEPLRPLGNDASVQVDPVDGANDGSNDSAKVPSIVPVVALIALLAALARRVITDEGLHESAPLRLSALVPSRFNAPSLRSVPPNGAIASVPVSMKRPRAPGSMRESVASWSVLPSIERMVPLPRSVTSAAIVRIACGRRRSAEVSHTPPARRFEARFETVQLKVSRPASARTAPVLVNGSAAKPFEVSDFKPAPVARSVPSFVKGRGVEVLN